MKKQQFSQIQDELNHIYNNNCYRAYSKGRNRNNSNGFIEHNNNNNKNKTILEERYKEYDDIINQENKNNLALTPNKYKTKDNSKFGLLQQRRNSKKANEQKENLINLEQKYEEKINKLETNLKTIQEENKKIRNELNKKDNMISYLNSQIVQLNSAKVNNDTKLYEDLKKENSKLKHIISEQSLTIKKLKNISEKKELEFHKEKENMLLKQIENLEDNNRDLIKNHNAVDDKISNLNLMLKNLVYKNHNNNNLEDKKQYIIHTDRTDRERRKKDVNDLIKEKESLINNSNYNPNDPLIKKIDSKIAKIIQKKEC